MDKFAEMLDKMIKEEDEIIERELQKAKELEKQFVALITKTVIEEIKKDYVLTPKSQE